MSRTVEDGAASARIDSKHAAQVEVAAWLLSVGQNQHRPCEAGAGFSEEAELGASRNSGEEGVIGCFEADQALGPSEVECLQGADADEVNNIPLYFGQFSVNCGSSARPC